MPQSVRERADALEEFELLRERIIDITAQTLEFANQLERQAKESHAPGP